MDIRDIPAAPRTELGPAKLFDLTKLRRSFVLAARSLWLHKMRAFLSVLGIIIGTSAVIALIAFGKGSMQDALEDIKRQGATNIVIRSVKPPDGSATSSKAFVANYGLRLADLNRIGTYGDIITRMVPMRVFPSEFRYLDRSTNGRLVATTEDYPEVNKLTMNKGRFLDDNDNFRKLNYCVLGARIADRLFPFEDPLGRPIVIRGQEYTVIGIVADRMPTGGTGGSQSAEDYNNDVYIPFDTGKVRIGQTVILRSAGSRSGERVEVSQVTLTIDADFDSREGRERVRAVGNAIRALLKEDHVNEDWAVTVPLDKLEEAERAQDRFTILLVMIASISLIVGGIGIMNIMLATVTERTREIGIRRALGAKRRDIVTQFLVEAAVQTSVGGLMGVATAMVIIFGVPPIAELFDNKLPAVISWWSILGSVGGSVMVGVFFGLYPAWRAARLDPIEALRHD
jgi:putative ABC transport system permease protein